MSMIFMMPMEIEQRPLSGSRARPVRMMEALRNERRELVEICGDGRTRASLWKQVEFGDVEAVYAELSTRPLALTDPDYIPRRPWMDMRMLRRLRRSGVPVGVFYRDVHWCFPQYEAELGFARRVVARAFHRLELKQLQRSVSHLFLPSMRMLDAVPIDLPRERVSALPPGAHVRDRSRRRGGRLRLFYVGGVRPPLYDLGPMLGAMSQVPDATLTLCCREREWEEVQDQYRVPDNVEIVHRAGNELDELYDAADVFLMYWAMTDYLEFAMPVKLFEAMGAGLPVIVNAAGETGALVAREDCGWGVAGEGQLLDLLRELAADPERARAKGRDVEEIRWRHTWAARARQVIETLDDYRRRGTA